MSMVLTSGVLAISIDAELNVERRGLDQQRSLEVVTRQLADLLAEFQMTATWAVADPAVSAATEPLTAPDSGHEIAILGDRSWVGREAGRSRFARELARRVTRARSAGLTIGTLLLRDTELDDHLDLVVKQGITAIAPARPLTNSGWFGRRPAAAVLPLRFGLWSLPTQAALPAVRRWFPWNGPGRGLRRAIEGAIARRELFHLSINGLDVAAQGRTAMRHIEHLLRLADRRRQQGALTMLTLRGVAERLTGREPSTPARSILRPAA